MAETSPRPARSLRLDPMAAVTSLAVLWLGAGCAAARPAAFVVPIAGSPHERAIACGAQVTTDPEDHAAQACLRTAAVRAGEAEPLLTRLRAAADAPGASALAPYFLARGLLLFDDRTVPEVLARCLPAASDWCGFARALWREQNGEAPDAAQPGLPASPEVDVARVRWALGQGNSEAVDALAAPYLTQESPEAWLIRARLALRADDRDGARRAALAAAAARPDAAEPHALLAGLADLQDDGGAGLDALRAAVAAAPGDIRLRSAWARQLLAERRPSAAAAQFQWLVARVPTESAFMAGLAEALLATGDASRAEHWADLALARTPTLGSALEVKAEAGLAQGELEAVLALRPRLLADPHSATARRLRLADAFARHGHDELAGATFAEATTLDPRSAAAWLAQARYVESRQGPLRALRLLEIAAGGPAETLAPIHRRIARLREGFDDRPGAVAALERALALDPEDPDAADERARLAYEAGAREDAIGRWTALLARDPHAHRARMRLSKAWRDLGQPEKAVPLLLDLTRHRPRDGGVQLALADALLAAGDPEGALGALAEAQRLGANPELVDPLLAASNAGAGHGAEARAALERTLARQPENRTARLALARLLERTGAVADALQTYEALLARDPGDLEALAGQSRLAAADGGLSPSPARWPAAAKDPTLAALVSDLGTVGDREATVLRDEREVVLDGQGIAAIRHIRSVLVHKPEAVDRLRTTQVAFHAGHPPTVVRARTLTPDGLELPVAEGDQVERNPHAGTALFGDARALELRFGGVEPGAIIDSEVITHRPHPDLKDTWWDGYILANTDPTVLAQYALQLPDATRFTVRAPGMGDPKETHDHGQRRMVWTRTHLPANALRGPEAAEAAAVYVSSLADWRAVDRWYDHLFAPQAAVTPALKARALAITAGLKTRRARIAAIYRYVEREVRYLGLEFGIGAYQPRNAERTLRLARGDCKDMTALMVALLAAIDVPARPALIRPRGQGAFIEAHPSPGQFSHVLLYVPDPKGDLWLDATSGMGTLDAVPGTLRGRRALVVDGRGGKLMTVPDGKARDHTAVQDLKYVLTDTGGGRLVVRTTLTGDLAGQARQKLLPLTPEARQALLAGPGGILPGNRPPDLVTAEGVDDPLAPLVLTANLDHPDLAGVRLDGTVMLPAFDMRFLMEGPLPLVGTAPLLGGPRVMTRTLTVRPPANHDFGGDRIGWAAERGPVHLTVAEARSEGEATVTARFELARGAQDDEVRAALLVVLKRAEMELNARLAMAPGPGFDHLAFLGRMVAEQPDEATLQVHLGRALMEANKVEAAAEALARAVSLGASEPRVLAMLAGALMRTPDPGRAVAPLERLAAVEGADLAVDRMLASLLVELGRWPEARTALARARGRHADDPALERLWLLVVERSGDPKEALAQAEARAVAHPDDSDAQRAIGDLAQRAGDPARAERAWRASLALRPNQASLLNNIAWLLRDDAARREEAVDLVNQALALDPTSDSAWDTLAELAVRAGDRAGARRAWREAARHAPARRARYEARLRALDGVPNAPR